MQLVNHEFFAKMALDSDYRVTNVRLDHDRFYSVATTTRVQQLENYGQPREHMIPEGQGGGYLEIIQHRSFGTPRWWGLYRDGDDRAQPRIPAAFLRVIADPIVRHVSRGAMLIWAIKQTEDAVLCKTAAKPATCPASRNTPNVVTFRVLNDASRRSTADAFAFSTSSFG